jgi:pyruvate/2-oxoglutarate dehydrogenase complex dihydrolipoamide dehydrogenase (E3) component
MGCRERTRGALSIAGTRPAGIYSAGTAQRLVNLEGYLPGKRVVILGSGDIGLIMARRMMWEGAKVEMVCELMPYSSGLTRNIVQCLQDFDIPLFFNTTVIQIHGKERVEGVTIAEVDPATRAVKKETQRFVPCDTLLLSVGLIPENEISRDLGVVMDAVTSGARVDQYRQTSVPGVFASGNVLHVHDLVDNVSRESIIAGQAAADYALGKIKDERSVATKATGGVRYVVPQKISLPAEGKVQLFFRVGNAYKPAGLTVTSGEKVLIQRKVRIMTPGEMQNVEIDLKDITGDITVDVISNE